ncbi:hypothetical protein ACFOGJ_06990 [Marinibaculum pumilum]|uniref:Uncharacterized protein n=1 Tax=Marinibaculum pumilum TaxID=1766165 RepID=A0ABV7KY95_9PROT
MRRLTALLALLVVFVLIVGAVFLATWEIPAPTKTVEKPISSERLRQ